jgi:citrate lyase subunit beta/citryl-CoA lyase
MSNASDVSVSRVPRSMLFVPASRPEMIAKAARSAADAVCIDLEDSVASDEKSASRAHVIAALRTLDFGERLRLVRINALDTPFAYRDVVDVVEAAGDAIDLVMVPKVGSARDVVFVAMLLEQIEQARGLSRPLRIEAQIETAEGFVNLRDIAAASPRLDALIFGPGDYAASMGMPSTSIGAHDEYDEGYPGHRWHAVMHMIVACARANRLRCVDGPYAAFRDDAGFTRSCRIAHAMGFDGKQCIHPSQLEPVNGVFSLTPEEIEHAERIVQAYELAAANGLGAVTLDGRMIDAANIRMARVVLEKQKLQTRGRKSHNCEQLY